MIISFLNKKNFHEHCTCENSIFNPVVGEKASLKVFYNIILLQLEVIFNGFIIIFLLTLSILGLMWEFKVLIE